MLHCEIVCIRQGRFSVGGKLTLKDARKTIASQLLTIVLYDQSNDTVTEYNVDFINLICTCCSHSM